MANQTTTQGQGTWRWIVGGAAAIVVAAGVLYLLASDRQVCDACGAASAGVYDLAHPDGWAASRLHDEPGAAGPGWVFERDGGDGYATITVTLRALPGGLSPRGYARQHGGEPARRVVAGRDAWQIAALPPGTLERAVFVPVPGAEQVLELRLVTGPVRGPDARSADAAATARATDISAFEAMLSSLRFES